jgi:hypothetical protein|tara:strand:+ start:29190 stop:29369 length:180 start_codon:yes stop_codon:yes gene_type:complete
MTELDSLFKLDGDLDDLDKNVHQKYVSVPSVSSPAPDSAQEASCLHTNPGARGPGAETA